MALQLAARGHEAWSAELQAGAAGARRQSAADRSLALRLNSNENPLGPSPAARAAIEQAFAHAGRYPMNAAPSADDFRALVAREHRIDVSAIALGAGSGEILESAVLAFTSPARALVSALPTFEAPARTAKQRGVPVRDVLVDAAGKLDLDGMVAAAAGAGLVFICNPNNPTATVHSAGAISDAVARIRRASPDTVILIDEAYHDYVIDSSYASAIPLVRGNANVLVSRTLSKLHGMAGLRLGYVIGQPDTVGRLAAWTMPFNGNVLALAAACASLKDAQQIVRERRRNIEALKFATDLFRGMGFATTESQANFMWVDLQRSAKDFRDACEQQGVLVGRLFAPFDKTHCRISIGTIDEMRRAAGVFRSVLGGIRDPGPGIRN